MDFYTFLVIYMKSIDFLYWIYKLQLNLIILVVAIVSPMNSLVLFHCIILSCENR